MATSGLYGNTAGSTTTVVSGMTTSGLYGNTAATPIALPSGSETSGLYGNNTVFGGTYFEWFIFQDAASQPATPTGGSWDFTTNLGTPPTGWSNQPPVNPTYKVWVSIALVNSRSSSTLTWSTPGLMTSAASGTVTSVGLSAPSFLSVSGSPVTTSGTLALTYSGTALPVANGGTGTTTPNLVAGTNVTITGTWPNQTINSTSSGGTVTSVTATSPVLSSGGTTPVISLPAATSSVSGYLTSTDWNTFNNKQPAGSYLTSVTADSPLVGSGTSASHLSIPAATSTTNGYLTSTDWTTFNNKGSGSVTSVAASVPSFLSVSGSPITTSGTLAITYSGTALPVANGGTGTSTPSLVAGTNVSITGTWPNQTINSTASGGTGTVTSVAASVPSFLSVSGSPITTSGTLAISYSGTALPVANGGTGVTTSSGANSVVLRDANANITTNCLFEGFSSQAASGTTIVLTASSVQNFQITGSGGQVIRLPNATTLPNGALFTFNNNQSSGSITVQNNSSTTVATINSGGYVTVVLLDNSTAAGSWDRHDQTPSNVSWSTNTLDYPGSITSATWNGNVVAINRGGTGASTKATGFNALSPMSAAGDVIYGGTSGAGTALPIGTAGQVLTVNSGATAPQWSTPTTGTVTSVSGTGTVSGISLSGTVTSSGSLTLGGTLDLSSPPAIGGTSPAAGTFTTLIGNSTSQFGKSSANYIQAVGAATTVSPVLSVQSSTDTNVDFSIKSLGTGSVLLGSANGTAISAFDGGSTIAWWQFVGTTTSTGNLIQRVGGGGTNTTLISVAKGTGSIQFATNNTATNLQLNVANTASAVNYVQVTGSPTGATASTGASILFTGSDAAVSGTIIVKGTSSAATISFAGSGSANYHAFRVQTQGSINTGNLLQVQGAAAGSAPSMQAISGPSGTDANIDITLTPKGTGRVNITTSIKPKVNSASNVTSPLAWDSTSYDEYAITALANALTINADANASPADGQKMMFRFKDNGTARALTWTTGATNAFRVVGVTLPTTTVASKIVYVGCIYNAADSRWDAVAVSQEA